MSLVISKKNKLIFFHIPKNAGTSMSNVILKNEVYYYPWIICSKILRKFTKKDNFFYDNYQKKIHLFRSHETLSAIEEKISPEIFNNFFKFAVVRNPFSRFVSRYNYIKSVNKLMKLNFFEFVKNHVKSPMITDKQYKFLLNKNGKIGVDKILKFENINNEIYDLSKIINLDPSKFQKLNVSTLDNYKNYYDENTKKIVENFCKEDLEYFNYSF